MLTAMLDSKGLTYDERDPLDDDKREFALDAGALACHGFDDVDASSRFDLESVVRHVRPTVLIGTSGTPGTFTEPAIRAMAEHARMPLILPLSNPTSKTEVEPAKAIEWTDGRALVATGSPFDPIEHDGRRRLIGQANNAFVFPGVGLGDHQRDARGDRRNVPGRGRRAGAVRRRGPARTRFALSFAIGAAEGLAPHRDPRGQEARDVGLGRSLDDDEIELAVDAAIWEPVYPISGA